MWNSTGHQKNSAKIRLKKLYDFNLHVIINPNPTLNIGTFAFPRWQFSQSILCIERGSWDIGKQQLHVLPVFTHLTIEIYIWYMYSVYVYIYMPIYNFHIYLIYIYRSFLFPSRQLFLLWRLLFSVFWKGHRWWWSSRAIAGNRRLWDSSPQIGGPEIRHMAGLVTKSFRYLKCRNPEPCSRLFWGVCFFSLTSPPYIQLT